MKKLTKYLILLLVIALSAFTLFACREPEEPTPSCPPHVDSELDNVCDICGETLEVTPPEDETPDLSAVVFADKTVVYNGEVQSIEAVGVPEGVLVSYVNNNKKDAGTYEVTASFYYKGEEITEARRTATLEIMKADMELPGVSLPSSTHTYNGEDFSPEIVGTLPDGVSVSYTIENSAGETVTKIVDADTYTVFATFRILRGGSNYHPIAPMQATVIVKKAKVDVSGISLPSSTHTYDGTDKTPTIQGTLPEDVTVSYTIKNSAGEVVYNVMGADTYTVTAALKLAGGNENYEEIPELSATVEIRRADIGGISFSDGSFYYDGEAKSIFVTGVPEGVEVNYTVTNSAGEVVYDVTDPGSYTVTATFEVGANYNELAPMSRTLEIKRYTLMDITFDNATFDYDGEAKSIFVVGAPSDLTVNYSGNGVSAPGTYTVTATFNGGLKYEPLAPMKATITILPPTGDSETAGLIFEEISGGYAVSGVEGTPELIIIPSEFAGKPVITVKANAFRDNTKLTYVYIPDSVKAVAYNAFRGCTALSEVRFGELTTIGQYAFADTALTSVVLPDSLVAIGMGAFEGTPMESITLPFVGGSHVTSNAYLAYIFGAQSEASTWYYVPTTLKTVIISDACTEIPAGAFKGLTGLTTVKIGNNVKKIGNSAFAGCTGLSDIFIPDSATVIAAAAKPENSPFFGCSSELLIVVEKISAAALWGRYFATLDNEGGTAIVVYNKTYEDYLMNKDSFRDADPTDATLAGIFVGDVAIDGFAPDVYEYTVDADINTGYPEISAIAVTAAASVEVSDLENGVITVTVTSADGSASKTYKVTVNVVGTFESSSVVVNKNNAKGTVTFVVDDGYTPTASFMKLMMEKYEDLAVTYAVYTKRFLTTSTEYSTDNGLIIEDIDGDGMMEYVLDENGRYTYVRNEETIAFWEDILSVGRSEIVAHSHTHAFWGVNDEGGAQLAVGSSTGAIGTKIDATQVEGSSTKEIYAAMQIIKDIFGESSRSITYVTPGIPSKEGNTTVTEEKQVSLTAKTVRVLYDTAVRVEGDVVYLADLTWVNLQSTVGTLPKDTDIVTTADTSSGIIPAGTPIYLAKDTVTVPVTDRDGNQNVVKGYGAYYRDYLYKEAFEDGTMIGARSTGQKVYVASDFKNESTRLAQKAYMITAKTDDASTDAWKKHIDNAIAANGGWASFCIHAMTENVAVEGQGGHKITWAQAEDLFSYAAGKGNELWIATQTDATLYYHQWSTSTVSSSYDAATGKVSVSLTDEENDEIYDMALTVKVAVPATWQTARVGDTELKVEHSERGGAYVLVDVLPETTVEITE